MRIHVHSAILYLFAYRSTTPPTPRTPGDTPFTQRGRFMGQLLDLILAFYSIFNIRNWLPNSCGIDWLIERKFGINRCEELNSQCLPVKATYDLNSEASKGSRLDISADLWKDSTKCYGILPASQHQHLTDRSGLFSEQTVHHMT